MSNSLAAMRLELVREWSEKNLPLTPDKITYGSNKIVWWKAACGHEWQTSVKARSSGEKCPICSGARVVEGINDLATLKPELAQEWSEKNEIKPTEVSIGSHKKVIWKCRYGHEWKSVVYARIKGIVCPVCADRAVLPGYNDLATTDLHLINEWDYEKNKNFTPDTVSRNSMKSVWWKCSLGHSWKAKIYERAIEEKGCPVCEQEYRSVFPQLVVSYYAGKKGLQVRLNTDIEIGLPLETYIVNERLAIESKVLSEEKERLKAYICRKQGIKLLKLPYKANEGEIEYIRKIKKAYQSVHIFIASDDERDTAIIRKRFKEWRKQIYQSKEME